MIFPHQLFKDNNLLTGNRSIYFIEDPLFFGDHKYNLNFHKKKLVLHRASLKYYEDLLHKKMFKVKYLDYFSLNHKSALFEILKKDKVTIVHYFDTNDFILEKRISNDSKNFNIIACKYETPNFITSSHLLNEYFSNKNKYFFTDFYIRQRKELGILIDEINKPVGGKWTYDKENRKKLPKNIIIPKILFTVENTFVKEAKVYVNKYFPDNIGSIDNFGFSVTHEDAENMVNDFLSNRFINFGEYEDAVSSQEKFLFHSLLSSSINIGLINPNIIIDKVLSITEEYKIPLNSLEGFIRQIIGWREFIRGVYIFKGTLQRNSNFFNHTDALPESFYNADTGILPVDNVIKNLLEGAYSHHIERLMIIGNFMMLCEINPNDIYKWFMELYIDSYDWVMVPNVYGMSQYADGGLITTKPYISSSNYIRKMSDYKKGEWSDIWDSLYWRFIHKHQNFFEKNPRLSMMTIHLRKMSDGEIKAIIKKADQYLNKLFN